MRGYLIAAEPRVGGNWLCAELTRIGLGEPGEWLNWVLQGYDEHGELVDLDYITADLRALWRRHGVNGIYGVKVHWTPGFDRLDLGDVLPAWSRAYIRLTRADRDAQVRSYAIAREHGCWFEPRPDPAPVDDHDIALARADLEIIATGWEHWFHRHAITPLAITYEDVVADLDAVLDRITTEVTNRSTPWPRRRVPAASGSRP